MDPYRETAIAPTEQRPIAELVYRPEERGDQRGGCLTGLRIVGLPALVGAVVWAATDRGAGVGAFLLALVLTVLVEVRRRKPGAVLRVALGELTVSAVGSRKVLWRVPLKDLRDVVLDTKKVERVLATGAVNFGSSVLGPTVINQQVAPETDMNRIVLEASDGSPPFQLTEDFYGHCDSLEWFGKVRVFLRKSGWVPASEEVDDARGS